MGSINFLDLKIGNKNGKHVFSIFRKSTYMDIIIDLCSNHPSQHKKASFNFAINRLFKLPLAQEERDEEMNITFGIAKANNYSYDYVNRLYKKIGNKFQSGVNPVKKSDDADSKKFLVLPFYGIKWNRIASVFGKYNVTTAFSTSHSLGNILLPGVDIKKYVA